MTTFSVLGLGFLLGLKHATESDHLTAVATLATRHGSLRQMARQGIAWGLGHSLMLLGIGSVVLALGQVVPAWLAQALECAVGLMLVVLGADVLRRVLIDRLNVLSQGHVRSGDEHMSGSPVRALLVGMVHGMAGSAALIVLSVGAMQSAGRALLYIVTFGIGSIAGMAVLSAVISGPLRLSAIWLGERHWILMGLIGAFSCALGVLVVCRMGI